MTQWEWGNIISERGNIFWKQMGNIFQEKHFSTAKIWKKFNETGIVFADLAVGGVEPELRGLSDEDRDVGAGRGLEVEGRGAVLEKPEPSVS